VLRAGECQPASSDFWTMTSLAATALLLLITPLKFDVGIVAADDV
jgi:hypothetical protein